MSELRIFFNEYFERKPSRLNERQDEKLFTLEPTDVNNFEFMTVEEHVKEIKSLKAIIVEARPWVENLSSMIDLKPRTYETLEEWLAKTENIKVEK